MTPGDVICNTSFCSHLPVFVAQMKYVILVYDVNKRRVKKCSDVVEDT